MEWMTQFMRGYSVRARMLGAIAVVTALLLLIAAAGWWGLQQMQGLQEQALALARASSSDAAASARVAALAAQAEQVNRIALLVFAIVVGVSVAIVAPTTIANMHAIQRTVEQAQGLAVSIARGDLTTRADLSGQDELAELMRCLDDMQASLARTVGEVRAAADTIRDTSVSIASGNQDLSQRTEQTAAHLQQTASRIDHITANVRASSEAAQSATALAQENATAAERGGEVVAQVVTTMDAIQTSSQKIADIIGVIDAIAFQTNILALNAAVEAARAGEAGRGFAVVAAEVRALAQRSSQAARDIKQLITDSVEKVSAGTQLVHQSGAAMRDVVANAEKVSAFIQEITAATHSQAQGLAQINAAVAEVDRMTQQNAALVAESASAATRLREQAQRLADLVAVFRLLGSSGAHPPLVPAAVRGHGGGAPYHGPERRRAPR